MKERARVPPPSHAKKISMVEVGVCTVLRSNDKSFIIDYIGWPQLNLGRVGTTDLLSTPQHIWLLRCETVWTDVWLQARVEAAHPTGNTPTLASQFVVPDYEIGVVVVNLSKMRCFASFNMRCPPLNISSPSHQSRHCFLGTFWLWLWLFTRHSSPNRGRLIADKGRAVGHEGSISGNTRGGILGAGVGAGSGVTGSSWLYGPGGKIKWSWPLRFHGDSPVQSGDPILDGIKFWIWLVIFLASSA